MILVVCPNLAVDVTLEVDRLVPGAVHRAESSRRQAGGKGVNVARALAGLGEEPCLLGFASGANGDVIARGLESEDIRHELFPFAGENRTCTIVLARDGSATVVNERGPHVEQTEATALRERFDALLSSAKAVVLMGSLPPGLPVELYADMVDLCRSQERFCLVDTSGEPLARAIAARPHVAKPNLSEAEALLSDTIATDVDRKRALGRLRALGAEIAVVTDGASGIYVGSTEGYARYATDPANLTLGNPTGAGDSLAAGLVAGYARGYGLEAMARLGVAAATASLAEGYGRIRARDIRVDAVAVTPL